jgi:lysozyme
MLDAHYLNAIKQSEGYAAEARWDYAQNTNGYGTRAQFPGEVIDKAEADRRFKGAIQNAANFVDKFAPNLDEGSKAALTSLTYNAGTAWAQSGLGEAIASGNLEKAQSIFLQYNKAGGSVLDGLVQRRLQEVAWFGQGTSGGPNGSRGATQETQAQDATTPQLVPAMNTGALSGPNPMPVASTAVSFATSSGSHGSSGFVTSDPRAFTSLAGDPALLSLLSNLMRDNLLKQDGGDQPAKPDRQNLSV